MKTRTLAPTSPSVAAQVAALPTLSLGDLHALWRRLFEGDALSHNRPFLERRIAYKLQDNAFRTVDPTLLDRNQRRIRALINTESTRTGENDRSLIPGTVFTREYHGVSHRVVVAADGQLEYAGRRYASLSKIAREITGTRWSGPLFFGMRAIKTDKPKASTKRVGSR